jgi:hypothetical protein
VSDAWDAEVTSVAGDVFTVLLHRDGHRPLVTDFSMSEHGITVVPGDRVRVTPGSVTLAGRPVA